MDKLIIFAVALILVAQGQGATYPCDENNQCDVEKESCLYCVDCSCALNGLKSESFTCGPNNADRANASCNYVVTNVPIIGVPEEIQTRPAPVYAKQTGYLQVSTTATYSFQFTATNVAFRLKVDGSKVIDAYLPQKSSTSVVSIVLQKDWIHVLDVEMFSLSNNSRMVSLKWREEGKEDFRELDTIFFNYKGKAPFLFKSTNLLVVCGDHIADSGENCPKDVAINRVKASSMFTDQCGDGLCLERFPETCFADCYTEITKECSPLAPPPGHISPGLPVRDDTFGNLIRNQMLWHLPGSEHLQYGYDVIRGQQSLYPIFYFGYCNDSRISTVQDTYRGNVYTIPEELFAQPSPKCTFSVDSNLYSSAVKMARATAFKYGIDASIEGHGKFLGASASASLAFSYEKSTQKARELETKASGSVMVTEVTCETSKVQLAKYTFHPVFLSDLAKANSTTAFKKVIQKYGTHFYNNAVLGGRLRQITTMSKDARNSKTKEEVSEHGALSFSASVSVPVFSAGGSVSLSGSIDSSTTSEDQGEFEKHSFRSSVITYGGPPGSFGPTTSDAPSNFGDWASNIDLLPVPIDFQLKEIADIIPKEWTIIFNGIEQSVKYVWTSTLIDFLSDQTPIADDPLPYQYTLYYSWQGSINTNFTSEPTMTIIWNDKTNQTLKLEDQRPSYPSIPKSFAGLDNPWKFDFGLSRPLVNISNIQIDPISVADVPNPITYGKELFILDWQTSTLIWSNKNTSGLYSLRNDEVTNYQIFLTLSHISGPPMNNGLITFTLSGIGSTTTGIWRTTVAMPSNGASKLIKLWPYYTELDPLRVGVLGKVLVTISDPSNTVTNSTVFGITDLRLSTGYCISDINLQNCTTANTSLKRVFSTPPGRLFTISNTNKKPAILRVYPLNSFLEEA